MSARQPITVQPWIQQESLRLAETWPTHEAIVASYFTHEPAAALIPHMRERLEREALTLRLPPRRPRWLPISAGAMRTALATMPISVVALALTGKSFEPHWNGDGWALPPRTTVLITCIIVVALCAMCLQVAADWTRIRHEEDGDTAFVAFQLSQFYQRANEYVASQHG